MHNILLAEFRRGGSVAAVWLALGSPVLAEFAVEAGATIVVLDLQHGLWQRRDMEAAIGHIRKSAVALVRVSENRPHAIGEALDAGALGVIVPIVETAAEARAAVAAAKYPPLGIRSGGGVRPLGDFAAYVASANAEILVSVMVETAKGVENVDDIAAVPGVDMIFIGPGDLALSLEEFPVAGEKVAQAIARTLAACKKAGLPCGIFTSTPQEAARRLAEGFQFVVASDDMSLLRNGLKQNLAIVSGDKV
jgi:2-dehydro-3-deoxyglucarate aldolase/4-hydroxy-2-oxoheptanedioate aldolase